MNHVNPTGIDTPHQALIGCSGFVGSVLLRQTRFTECYHSRNISASAGRRFDQVVCSAAPAQKWIANQAPQADRANIDRLIASLDHIECDRLILISTVDVFANPMGVDERSTVSEEGLHAYGLNRRVLEKYVQSRFTGRHLIVRLGGLVGPGLRKNVIFDFQNDNNLQAIDSRGTFQFYPMVNLWYDIQSAMKAGLSLVHLTAAPVTVEEVAREGFNRAFCQHVVDRPAVYDFRTCHAEVFGGTGPYQYSRRETLLAIRAYAQSEPRTDLSAKSHAS